MAVYYCLFNQKTLPTRFRYNFLKVVVVFFLFPFPEFKYLLLDALKRLFNINLKVNAIETLTAKNTSINLQYANTILPLALFSRIHIIVSGIIITFSIFWQVRNYLKIKFIYRESSVIFDIHNYVGNYDKIKKEIGIKKRIYFAFSGVCDSPLIIGIFSPVILFPREMEGKSVEEWDLLLRHELNHIKAYDLCIRFVAQIAQCVHWFNPMAYLLYSEICSMSEIHCDAKAVINYEEEMKEKYCRAIINWSENREEKCVPVPLRFIGNRPKDIVERRVSEMKQPKKQKRFMCLLSAMITGIVGTTSVLAYEAADPIQILQDLHPNRDYSIVERMDQIIELNPNTGDIFVDKNGNIYETNSSERVLCLHNYVDIIISEHELHSDGSCTTLYYDAKRCTKCGTIKDKKYNGGKTTYEKCPH